MTIARSAPRRRPQAVSPVVATLVAAERLVWEIRGWRGGATRNATRPAHWALDAAARKHDRNAWASLYAVAMAGQRKPGAWNAAGPYRCEIAEWGAPMRDVGATVEAAKAALDVLVAAGWLVDDSPLYVPEILGRRTREPGIGCRVMLVPILVSIAPRWPGSRRTRTAAPTRRPRKRARRGRAPESDVTTSTLGSRARRNGRKPGSSPWASSLPPLPGRLPILGAVT